MRLPAEEIVKVEVLGQVYTIRSYEGEEKVLAAAGYLNEQVSRVFSKARAMGKLNTLVLAALSICSDYLELKEEHQRLVEAVESKSKHLVERIEEEIKLPLLCA